MSQQDEIRYLPRQEAAKIVAAIQEEEDIGQPDHRILTVYNHANKEVCWYDFDEVMREVGPGRGDEHRAAVSEYILTHLPEWARDI